MTTTTTTSVSALVRRRVNRRVLSTSSSSSVTGINAPGGGSNGVEQRMQGDSSSQDESDDSSEDFHRYVGVFGPATAGVTPSQPEDSATSRRGHRRRESGCIEVLDDFGHVVAPPLPSSMLASSTTTPPTSTITRRSRWDARRLSDMLNRGVEFVSRVFAVPTDATTPPVDKGHHDPTFAVEQHDSADLYDMATHPERIPTSYIRSRLHRDNNTSNEPTLSDATFYHMGEHEPLGYETYDAQQCYYEEEDDDMSLAEAIIQCREVPGELSQNLVSALLAVHDPISNPVTAEHLELTEGNPFLVMTIIESGALPVTFDAALTRCIQTFVDRLIVASPQHRGRLPPTSYDYLKCLVSTPHVTLSRDQVQLLRGSGFEFASLLRDRPHLMAQTNYPLEFLWRALGRRLDFPLAVLGILLVTFDFVSLGFCVQYWYRISANDQIYGHITLLVFGGGFVCDMLMQKFLMRKKVSSVVYEGRVAPFPSISLKVVPCLPMYELVLLNAIVRHKLDAARCDKVGGNQHRAILHDLYAAGVMVRVSHSVFYSLPHALIQSYFFSWGDSIAITTDSQYFGFLMLVVSSIACIILGIVLFVRQISVFDSVSYMGFASFATEKDGHIVVRDSAIPRTLTFALVYLFEVNVFFVVLGVMDVADCDKLAVWIGTSSGVVLSCIIIFLASVVNSTSVYRAAKWFVVPVAIQSASTIYMILTWVEHVDASVGGSGASSDEDCRIFAHVRSITILLGIITWATFGVVGLLWLLQALFADCIVGNAGRTTKAPEQPPPMPGQI